MSWRSIVVRKLTRRFIHRIYAELSDEDAEEKPEKKRQRT